MKRKFVITSILLLFSRGCDYYSTALWFHDNPSGETNPLVRWFGFGWGAIWCVNALVVGLVMYSYFYYLFRYKPNPLIRAPKHLRDYVSLLYFQGKEPWYKLFYKFPVEKKVLLAHSGYILIRSIIFASFLATIHNLCQFYQFEFYNIFRESVKRPLYVIYSLILLYILLSTRQLLKNEYRQNLKSLPENYTNLSA